jgi:ergothioneine biosynthesis protein EgtB
MPQARPHASPVRSASAAGTLAARFETVRAQSLALAAPLSEADCQVQSMPDASPAKWHLAHVTWFFETLVLERFEPGFAPHDPAYRVLFNSYYNGIGEQHPRPQRGLITRPDLAEVLAYRRAVDERLLALLADDAPPLPAEALALIELGLHHEQQHQELLLTDVLHLFSCNPLAPVYQPRWPLQTVQPVDLSWVDHHGGLVEIGHAGDGFAFDNEAPRHRQFLAPYRLANRLATNHEWLAFMADGGYRDPRWWLSAGWDWVRTQSVRAPLYWRAGDDGRWWSFTLHGLVPVDPHTPVTHVSLYEADAYARWAAAQHGLPLRLPTEAEWEHAAAPLAADAQRGIPAGNFVDTGALHPLPVAQGHEGLLQLYGDGWEWTSSAYAPYPGFRPNAGAVGEYNAKFMCDQTVLRGGSCATPRDHVRASYRNFFPSSARWQFTAVRLACDA